MGKSRIIEYTIAPEQKILRIHSFIKHVNKQTMHLYIKIDFLNQNTY